MPKPYVPAGTKSRFYRPPQLAADFEEFLDGDLPHMVMDLIVYKDWYEQFDEDYEETIVRGEVYADTAKSRYSNTDTHVNLRCAKDSGIRKGDMIRTTDVNNVYILDWGVTLQANNAPSRMLLCNMYFTAERWHPEIVDENAYVVEEEGWTRIVDRLPANGYFYDGRAPDYRAETSNPGIIPGVVAIITAQYNEQTKNLHVGDEFVWGGDKFVITDISYSDLDIDETFGFLKIQATQKAGGIK